MVVFSPGLLGMLEFYQQLCRDMASMGVIVVEIEHEDGSGGYATDCSGDIVEFAVDPAQYYEHMDVHLVEYNATIEAIRETIEFGGTGQSPTPIEEVLSGGRADRIVLTGHSFGGAGTFYYLRHLALHDIPSPLLGAIMFDQATTVLDRKDYVDFSVREPFVYLTSEDWNGQDILREVVENNPTTALAAAQIKGTNHMWITVVPFMLSIWQGDYQVYGNTMQAVNATLAAFLDPDLQPLLRDSILAVDPDVVVPI